MPNCRRIKLRTARSKGLRERDIVGGHVLRNALLPFVTIVGLMMANFIGGTVVTEAVFTYPGLGRLLITAISTRDYPLIQGCILVIWSSMWPSTWLSMCSTPTSIPALNTPDRGKPMTLLTPSRPAEMFDLTGQVALVTGASRGLGWAIAQVLAGAGATVVLNGREEATLSPRRDALRASGLSADIAPFDVRDANAVVSAVDQISARHGRLDILLSNAGSIVRKPLVEQSEEDWRDVIDADLTAGWRLAREAAPLMSRAGYGRMIFISSVMGSVARPGVTGYVAAKTGLHGLVRALAVELAPNGITVNALAPGYFPTEGNIGLRQSDPDFEPRISARTPMGRWGDPKELGAAALYLASPAAGFTTGSVLTVDGGLTAAI